MQRMGKVLVIEDDMNLVCSLSRTMKRAGYRVVSARDGTNGLDLVLLEDPDVILLDLAVPGMRGSRVLHEIRRRSDVPVVIITGELDLHIDLQATASHDVSAVFRKPFSTKELLRSIRGILGRD